MSEDQIEKEISEEIQNWQNQMLDDYKNENFIHTQIYGCSIQQPFLKTITERRI